MKKNTWVLLVVALSFIACKKETEYTSRGTLVNSSSHNIRMKGYPGAGTKYLSDLAPSDTAEVYFYSLTGTTLPTKYMYKLLDYDSIVVRFDDTLRAVHVSSEYSRVLDTNYIYASDPRSMYNLNSYSIMVDEYEGSSQNHVHENLYYIFTEQDYMDAF